MPLPQLPYLGGLGSRLTRLEAPVDMGTVELFLQLHRVTNEVDHHLLDRHSGLAIPRDAHNFVTELGRVWL